MKVLSSLLLLKQEYFRFGKIYSRPSEQIFAQARLCKKKKFKLKIFIFAFEILVYYCLLFLSGNYKFYLKL